MRFVALDTSGPVVGVAARNGERVALRQARAARGTEVLLTPWLAEVAAEVDLSLLALDAVIVAVGPGAFTGLRVGLAAGLGLALAARCPVVSVGSLDARARRVPGRLVASLLDARKGRVYAALYDQGARVVDPQDVAPAVVVDWAAGRAVVLTGEGATLIPSAPNLQRASDHDDPALVALLALGEEAFLRGEGQDPATVVPHYVRPPDAVPPSKASRTA